MRVFAMSVLACVLASSTAFAEESTSDSTQASINGTVFDNALDVGAKPPASCAKQVLWTSVGYYRPFWFEMIAVLHQHPEVVEITLAIPASEHHNVVREVAYAYEVITKQPATRAAYNWPEDIVTLLSLERYTDRIVMVDGSASGIPTLSVSAEHATGSQIRTVIGTDSFMWCQSLRRAVAWTEVDAARQRSAGVVARGSRSSGLAMRPAEMISGHSDPAMLAPARATTPELLKIPSIVQPPPITLAAPVTLADGADDDDEDDEDDDENLPAVATPPRHPTSPTVRPSAASFIENERVRCILAQRLVRGKAVRQPNGTISFVVEIPKNLTCTPK